MNYSYPPEVDGWLTYGPGIPRYLALWLPLAPVVGVVLARSRVPWRVAVAVTASTLPTFLLHTPPPWSTGARTVAVAGCWAVLGGWLLSRLRADTVQWAEDGEGSAVPWAALAAAALLAVALRAPLAWVDPGIGDFATASELAAQQLLAGANPYLQSNPHATAGTYQYPAGTILAHLPLVALDPGAIAGEEHLGARATLWAVDAAAVVALGAVLAAMGRPRAGVVAALLYAVHPTLVRESGIVVANDVGLGALAAGCGLALARRRPALAGALAGAAIAVKPAALVLVPVLLAAAGVRPALLALGLPAALQLPFLLLPVPGLHGLAAIAEPAARLESPLALGPSLWAALPPSPGLVRVLSVLGAGTAAAVGTLTGRVLRRRGGDPAAALAAVALPLLTAHLLATRWPANFSGWYLAPLLLCAALSARRPSPAAVRTP